MTKLNQISKKEKETAKYIQSKVEDYIESSGLTNEDLAEKLELWPEGVETLRKRIWSLEMGFRVAELLGLTISVQISDLSFFEEII